MAALMLVLMSVAGVAVRLPVAQAQYAPPGPGIGESDAQPAGRAVSLATPAGYTLRAVRGGSAESFYSECFEFDHGAPPPPCAYLRGSFTVTLVFDVDPAVVRAGATSNRDACRSGDAPAWSGWLLSSVSGNAQNILLPVDVCVRADGSATPVLTLPLPQEDANTVELTLSGYCVNLGRHVPDDAEPFTTGVITTDPGLMAIVAAINGKDLYIYESQSLVQDVVWDYSDFEKLDIGRLAELPSLR